jgi:general secretion pathway protein G
MRAATPIRTQRKTGRKQERGLTLIELIVTVAILSILASAAVPVTMFTVKREREHELRRDLWEMRDAIDHYKDAADMHAFQTKVDSQNYPPDLETLVNGVDVQGKKVKFLRKIPIDPMTGKAEWGIALHAGRSGRRTPSAVKACSTCIRSPWARRSTVPSIQRGERHRTGKRPLQSRSQMRFEVYRIRKQDAGFTLIELMIVMAIIGVLAMVAVPSYIQAIRHAREAVLKEDLHTLRAAIDSYTMDKQKAPQSLDDLLQDGYIKTIPEDPMTRSTTTWVTDTSDSMHSLDQTDPGIDDIHSGSDETGSDGQPYNTW